MHVLMLGGDLTASVGGGIGTVARTYMGAKAMHGVRIDYHTTVAAEGSRVHKARTMAQGQLRFAKRLATDRPDLLHIHIADGPSFWRKSTYAQQARLAGIPVCLHGHFTSLLQVFQSSRRVRRRAIQAAFAHADVVFALSTDMKQQVEEMSAGRATIRILHNPCPPDGFDPSPRPHTEHPNVLFMGRVGDRKGVFDLIEAWPIVLKAMPGARLTIAGDGELDRLRSDVARLDIAASVNILGWVSGEVRMAAYRQADVFCLPSYAEGLPMGVLEAMGAGLPVVSTAINGTPDAVVDGTTGFLHEPGDRDTLARHLSSLLTSRALRLEQGQAGYERVTAEFDPERQSERLRQMWTDVLAGAL
jgi:glycosyltransferase involved in cell wall biosynthesis